MKPPYSASILILEDEAIVALELEMRLQAMGYQTIGPVTSLDDAIKAVAQHQPDLILADIHIGGQADGIDVVTRINKDMHCPAVYLTALTDTSTLDRAIESAPYGYLIKPFREAELNATIRMALHRAKLEQKLRAREQQLAEAQRIGNMGHFMFDPLGGQSEWAEQTVALFGITQKEFRADPVNAFVSKIHPDDKPKVFAEYRKLSRQPKQGATTFRILLPDGTPRFVRVWAESLRSPQGQITISGVVQDATEQIDAETALEEWRTRKALAHELSGDGEWEWDIETGKVYYSKRWKALLGYSEHQISDRWEECTLRVHPDDKPRFDRMLEQHLRGETAAFVCELRMRTKFETYCWVLKRGKVSRRDELGRALRMVGSHTEITALKRAEELARSAHARFDALFRHSPDAMVVVDSVGNIQIANRTVHTLLGWDPLELIGQPVEILAPEALRKKHHEKRSHFDNSETTIRNMVERGPVSAQTKDGREIAVEINLSPVEIEGESLVIASIRDVSKRLAAEKKLQEREAQLQQTQRLEAVGRLAGGIAHDFNNLLTVILGMGGYLQHQVIDNPKATNLLRDIIDAGERAAALTKQLLTFARKHPGEPKVIDLNEKLDGMLRLLRRTVGVEVTLVSDLENGLWPVQTNPSGFEQIIFNLIINARDAMPHGGTVTVSTKNIFHDLNGASQSKCVQLTISDSGVGMTEEVIAHAFEPFFTTKGPGKGTGLGLATVYGVVHQAGGEVTVQSKPGLGTTFVIRLPIAFSSSRSDSVAPPVLKAGPEIILLVEDDDKVRQVHSQMLTEAGYQVVQANNGANARDIFSKQRVDLVLTDVSMPIVGGLRLAEIVTEHQPGTPILFISGFVENIELLEKYGPVLSKPVKPSQLIRTVQQMLTPLKPER